MKNGYSLHLVSFFLLNITITWQESTFPSWISILITCHLTATISNRCSLYKTVIRSCSVLSSGKKTIGWIQIKNLNDNQTKQIRRKILTKNSTCYFFVLQISEACLRNTLRVSVQEMSVKTVPSCICYFLCSQWFFPSHQYLIGANSDIRAWQPIPVCFVPSTNHGEI